MPNVVIRKAEPSDLAAINDIYNHAVRNTTATFHLTPLNMKDRRAWFDEHPEDTYPVFVAESEGRVVGWGALSRYASRCAYQFTAEDSIYVEPEHQGRGIGGMLLERLIEAARAAGHHSIIAQISDHNAASVRLHERFGFQTVGELREVGRKFERWLDITIMQKVL